MSIGWQILGFLAISLDLFVGYLVATRAIKRFIWVLIFCATQIAVSCGNLAFSFLTDPRFRHPAVLVFWTGDLFAHAVISALIISLIWQAQKHDPNRKKTLQLLIAGVLIFGLISAFVFHDAKHLNRWMTPLSRNLSFCEEVLNLVLWAMIIQRSASDYLLLMVSAGIGVQVTGEVIAHTLRIYSHSASTVWVLNVLLSMCEVLCLLIWVWAFRSAEPAPRRRLL